MDKAALEEFRLRVEKLIEEEPAIKKVAIGEIDKVGI
jgi:hypothetical protein